MELNENLLSKLYEDIDNNDAIKILHFIKWLEGYKANIICCGFKRTIDLKKYWQRIVNNTAMYVQANVNNRIEAFNIYIFFFADEVSSDLAYKVEQDKYSSRKIVISRKMPENISEIEKIIEDRLFECKTDDLYKEPLIEATIVDSFKELYEYLLNNEKIDINNLDDVINIIQKDQEGE
ncbi:hypothetical protein QB607_002797 [Clostridium botulinum]|nr:hypothetical protein [Clostridium botulinum]EKS4395276.1 hypothetical protein [Clostridium botulinum]